MNNNLLFNPNFEADWEEEKSHKCLVIPFEGVPYEMDTGKMAFTRFHVMLNNHQMEATAWGEHFDRCRHEPATEVKGATYTELSVHQLPNGSWVAQCVVDV